MVIINNTIWSGAFRNISIAICEERLRKYFIVLSARVITTEKDVTKIFSSIHMIRDVNQITNTSIECALKKRPFQNSLYKLHSINLHYIVCLEKFKMAVFTKHILSSCSSNFLWKNPLLPMLNIFKMFSDSGKN